MISIIIPLYNKEKCILKTINSITEQSFKEYEIIVVDDGSTDNGVTLIESLGNDKIRIEKKENGGPSSARNFGVRHATGDWILFLDADDNLEANALSNIKGIIDRTIKCHVFCFNHYVCDDTKKYIYSKHYKDGYLRNSFYSWCIGCNMPRAGAAVFSKEILLKYPFNEKLRRYEDAEHLFGIMREEKIYQCSIPIMTYNTENAEASAPRKEITEDYIGHLNPNVKGWWEHYAIYKLYIQGCYLYPEDMKRLYNHRDFWTWRVRLMNKYLKFMKRFNLL